MTQFTYLNDKDFLERPFKETMSEPLNQALQPEDHRAAFSFYEALVQIVRINPADVGGSLRLMVKIQELFETYVISSSKIMQPVVAYSQSS